MDIYDIDSHKLHLHPQRVASWLNGEQIAPVYAEISPSGSCNHRCIFCTMDFMGYKKNLLDCGLMTKRLAEMGSFGVKAVMFAGEGEPLLHPEISLLSHAAKNAGIDISFTTNGALLSKKLAEELLPVTSWIKISCNAGSADDYAKIHRTKAETFENVFKNLEYAANFRNSRNLACTLGIQCILLPDNAENLPELARRAKEAGADYLVIKPYTHNPQSLQNRFGDIKYDKDSALLESLKSLENESFKVICRSMAMNRWNTKKAEFKKCLALPFWAYIDSFANVHGCIRHLGEELFSYGNLKDKSFKDIWTGKNRLDKINECEKNLDITSCHVTCRMEAVNQWLWRLKHPAPHDNFI